MSSFLHDHQSMPDVFLFWLHHNMNFPYASRSWSSRQPPEKTARSDISTRPLAPKSTPQPKWKQWQLSGRIDVVVIPGIDSKGMCARLKGVVGRLRPIVPIHSASGPNRCQSRALQRWHFSVQLKPQFSLKAWSSGRLSTGLVPHVDVHSITCIYDIFWRQPFPATLVFSTCTVNSLPTH